MSEKIYAWLLRLYPSRFREAYGDDVLQLFRDRARDEKGAASRLRLWLDLLADLAISVPREYFFAEPELVAASERHRLDGTPSFYVLGEQSPRIGALLLGCMLSVAALVVFSSLLSHGTNRERLSAAFARQRERIAAERSSAPAHSASPNAADFRNETSASGETANATQTDSSQSFQSPVPQPRPQAAGGFLADGANLDANEQHRVIDRAISNLKQYYAYPDVGQKMADTLLAHEKNGDDRAATDGPDFARLLTKQMRDVSPDMHLAVVYSQSPLPEHAQGATADELAAYRERMKRGNCTLERVEVLPHNIGYLKFNSFPDPAVCQSKMESAMVSLNSADSIIFDLRDNRGGEPDMVMRMAAYLFDHPEYMYNPRENTTESSWTKSPVAGSNLADKPVYILTSVSTYSGAEQFCYDLKMLKRATLVGERTGGGAHAGAWHRIDDHFGMGIPETKPINPFAKADWSETGVEPDVKVSAADALQVAIKLAQSKPQKK